MLELLRKVDLRKTNRNRPVEPQCIAAVLVKIQRDLWRLSGFHAVANGAAVPPSLITWGNGDYTELAAFLGFIQGVDAVTE